MNAAPTSTYIGQFLSGGVDPSTPHLVLILAAVIGGLAVGVGIIWEAARSGHLWTLPTVLVFVGVVIEAAATVVLFEFDEGISRAQNSKIIALESRLAARTLSADDFSDIATKLVKFAPQSFETIPYPEDQESVDFANRVASILGAARWTPDQPTGYVGILGVVAGVVVYVDAAAPPSTKEAARALTELLNNKNIGTVTRRVQNTAVAARLNVTVGIKP